MLELLKKLDKKDSIDLNYELKDIELDENKALLIAKYMVENSKSIVREAYDVQNLKTDTKLNESLVECIKEIKSKKNIDKIEDKDLIHLINRGIAKAIENIKLEFSFVELVAETNLFALEFYNKFFSLIDRKNVFSVFDIYISIMQYQVQNKRIKEKYYNLLAILHYSIIQNELEKGRELFDILKELNIEKDYYNLLEGYYESYDIDIEENYQERLENVKKEYEFLYNSFLLDYIDSAILIDFLGLSGEKSKIKWSEKQIQSILIRMSEFEF